MDDTREQIKRIIAGEMNIEGLTPEDIADDAPLFGEGLGLDSLDAIELVLLVKMRFGVEIRSAEEGRIAFRSVSVLADYIRKRRGG
ncbi:MAG: acyl carrier protein [Deltaproteobacteria bacterium]|nr:acyl carrier protein [Deltaproteobacteria bacterium]